VIVTTLAGVVQYVYHCFVVVTKYQDINNLISRYISKYRRFPDYQDIRDIITRCNHRHSLKIKSAALLVMSVYEAATRRINGHYGQLLEQHLFPS